MYPLWQPRHNLFVKSLNKLHSLLVVLTKPQAGGDLRKHIHRQAPHSDQSTLSDSYRKSGGRSQDNSNQAGRRHGRQHYKLAHGVTDEGSPGNSHAINRLERRWRVVEAEKDREEAVLDCVPIENASRPHLCQRGSVYESTIAY